MTIVYNMHMNIFLYTDAILNSAYSLVVYNMPTTFSMKSRTAQWKARKRQEAREKGCMKLDEVWAKMHNVCHICS